MDNQISDDRVTAAIDDHCRVIDGLHDLVPVITGVARSLAACLQKGGKILWMGNGGSAADAQHLAAEFIGRFTRERRALPAIALTTDTSILTALANDYHFDRIFARQIEGLCAPADAVVGISTSGNSPNVLAGIEAARNRGAYTVGFAGGLDGGRLKGAADVCIHVPSPVTARVQEAHILIGHILCEMIEAACMEERQGV